MEDVTPAEAREQLADADRLTLSSRSDQRTHGLFLVFAGVLFGMGAALSRGLPSALGDVVTIAQVLVWFAGLAWLRLVSRSVPRNVTRISTWGYVGMVVCLAATHMTLNYIYRGGPEPVPALVLAGLIIALPPLVAAHRVFWGAWIPTRAPASAGDGDA